MGMSTQPRPDDPVESKTKPWGENRPLTAAPTIQVKLTDEESEAIRRIWLRR